MRSLRIPAVIVLGAVVGAGCMPGAPTISVSASEFKFEPATVTVKAGQAVQLSLKNAGLVAHDWTVEVEGQNIHVHGLVNQTAAKTFTPQKPGTYKVICSEPGHEQAGMVGQLVVE